MTITRSEVRAFEAVALLCIRFGLFDVRNFFCTHYWPPRGRHFARMRGSLGDSAPLALRWAAP